MSGQGRAACRSTDVMMLFFGPDDETQPERKARESKAKAVCISCPIRAVCLEYALHNLVGYGVWGGLNTGERLYEHRRRVNQATARSLNS